MESFSVKIKTAKFEGLTRTIHDTNFFCQINDETLPNCIKRKRNKGQGPKSRQANSPKVAGHKEERAPLRTEPTLHQLHEAYQLRRGKVFALAG